MPVSMELRALSEFYALKEREMLVDFKVYVDEARKEADDPIISIGASTQRGYPESILSNVIIPDCMRGDDKAVVSAITALQFIATSLSAIALARMDNTPNIAENASGFICELSDAVSKITGMCVPAGGTFSTRDMSHEDFMNRVRGVMCSKSKRTVPPEPGSDEDIAARVISGLAKEMKEKEEGKS